MHPLANKKPTDILPHLESEVQKGMIAHTVGTGAFAALELFDYTRECTAKKAWNDTTTLARGLVLNRSTNRFVTLPFPKFFNLGEVSQASLPELPFQCTEKLDGSLGIAFHHNGTWQVITRGSFNSEQGRWATAQLNYRNTSGLIPGTTYLFEIIYADNRIVVAYDFEDLVLIGGCHANGQELTRPQLEATATQLPCRIAQQHQHKSLADLVQMCLTMDHHQEGFVVCFANRLRLKIKGKRYCEVHRAIACIRPTSIWEFLVEDRNLDNFRNTIPAEFQTDFDCIRGLLEEKRSTALATLQHLVATHRHLGDKELAAQLPALTKTHPEARYLFAYRRNKFLPQYNTPNSCERRKFHKLFRPTANRLEGYHASRCLQRLLNADQT